MAQHPSSEAQAKVVKSNRLVQSRMNWTKLEHRVVAMLIAQLKKDDQEFEEQRVYIKDIADLSGRSGKSLYDQAEEICQKLLDQQIHVRTQTDDGRRRYKGYNCMSTCEYVEGSGYIEAKFNEDMQPFLLQLKRRFTQYNLQCFMQLSSQHAMRIYELLKMREGLRYLRIEVEELRQILCCEHSYNRFADFKRWVLEKAREELKEKADIYFNYKVERDGQTPMRINFIIKENGKRENGEPADSLIESRDAGEEETLGVENGAPHHTAESVQPENRKNGKAKGSATKPQFNVFAMVLDEMSQDELDSRTETEIRDAVTEAREQVTSQDSENGTANMALETYRRALHQLRN